jgi:Neuronal voltage-dependent calcium channel alpha 2acd
VGGYGEFEISYLFIYFQCTGVTGCRKTCASDELDCYLLDDNGFVILSERTEHTGKFFGKIDGTIMDSLVQDRIYRRVGLMDYQGTCSDRNNPYTAAGDHLRLTKPWFLNYAITLAMSWLAWLPNPIAAWPHAFYNYDSNEEDVDPHYDDFAYNEEYVMPDEAPPDVPEEEPVTTAPSPKVPPPLLPRVVPDPAHARPCDLKTDLFVLQPDRLNSSGQSNPLKVKSRVRSPIRNRFNSVIFL